MPGLTADATPLRLRNEDTQKRKRNDLQQGTSREEQLEPHQVQAVSSLQENTENSSGTIIAAFPHQAARDIPIGQQPSISHD